MYNKKKTLPEAEKISNLKFELKKKNLTLEEISDKLEKTNISKCLLEIELRKKNRTLKELKVKLKKNDMFRDLYFQEYGNVLNLKELSSSSSIKYPEKLLSLPDNINHKQIAQKLVTFIQDHGRLPAFNEPGEKLTIEANRSFRSLKEALLFSGLSTQSSDIEQPRLVIMMGRNNLEKIFTQALWSTKYKKRLFETNIKIFEESKSGNQSIINLQQTIINKQITIDKQKLEIRRLNRFLNAAEDRIADFM